MKGSADSVISALLLTSRAAVRAVGPAVSFAVPASARLTWGVQHGRGSDGVKSYCIAVRVPLPGAGLRSEIVSIKIVACVVLQRAPLASWADVCDENLRCIPNSSVTHC